MERFQLQNESNGMQTGRFQPPNAADSMENGHRQKSNKNPQIKNNLTMSYPFSSYLLNDKWWYSKISYESNQDLFTNSTQKCVAYFTHPNIWGLSVSFTASRRSLSVNSPGPVCPCFYYPVRRCRGPLLEGGSTPSRVAGTSVGRETHHRLTVGCVKP